MVHNAIGCLIGIGKNYFTFVRQKYKPIKLTSFYTSLMNTYRRQHLRVVVFLQYQIIC